MLISRFLSCALLIIHGAICNRLQEDPSSVNEKSSKQLPTDADTYGYHHPPLPESYKQKRLRTEKSINFKEQNTPAPTRPHTRVVRRRTRPRTSTPSSEIPVQVIYETAPTTVSPFTTKFTSSPLSRTTRTFFRRRNLQSNENKKVDIRQTAITKSSVDIANITEDVSTYTNKDKSIVSSTTEFPKRSRESYFTKRTETPTPRTKILEEKNFVFSHSGNFHYSFLGGDGTKISSQGSLRSYENNKTGEAVSGNVFYKGKDGNDYSLSYTADENGYRPVGAHLPTPPPLPPAIARALKYIADRSTQSPLTKGDSNNTSDQN